MANVDRAGPATGRGAWTWVADDVPVDVSVHSTSMGYSLSRASRKRAQTLSSRPVKDHAAASDSAFPPPDRTVQGASTSTADVAACGFVSCADQARTRQAPEELYVDLQRLMSAFGIYYDGRFYRYSGYRYDRLGDAVAYAELMQSRQSTQVGPIHSHRMTPFGHQALPTGSSWRRGRYRSTQGCTRIATSTTIISRTP
jgi:hypothetical protein